MTNLSLIMPLKIGAGLIIFMDASALQARKLLLANQPYTNSATPIRENSIL